VNPSAAGRSPAGSLPKQGSRLTPRSNFSLVRLPYRPCLLPRDDPNPCHYQVTRTARAPSFNRIPGERPTRGFAHAIGGGKVYGMPTYASPPCQELTIRSTTAVAACMASKEWVLAAAVPGTAEPNWRAAPCCVCCQSGLWVRWKRMPFSRPAGRPNAQRGCSCQRSFCALKPTHSWDGSTESKFTGHTELNATLAAGFGLNGQ
jgi:hypothetical protein